MTSRTVFFSFLMSLFLQVHGFGGGTVFAADHLPPFVAKVTGDQVNVRAGQSVNFERLTKLSKGEEVLVLDKEYSWYKIQLPSSAKSYVSKQYVQYLGLNAGGVAATDVNVRAGAGVHHTVLGKLTKGEQIYIQEDLEEWYRIEPIAESYGWVSDKFLAYKSGDLSGYQVAPPKVFVEKKVLKQELEVEPEPDPESETELQSELKPKLAMEKKDQFKEVLVKSPKVSMKKSRIPAKKAEGSVKRAIEVSDRGIISVVGYVESYENEGADGIFYKIVAGGQPVCYIQGVNHMLGRFVNHQVTVEGTVNQKLLSQYPHPVIAVLKVRLML